MKVAQLFEVAGSSRIKQGSTVKIFDAEDDANKAIATVVDVDVDGGSATVEFDLSKGNPKKLPKRGYYPLTSLSLIKENVS